MEPMKDSVIIITCNYNRLNFLHDMRMIINAVVFIRSSFDGETKTKFLLSSRKMIKVIFILGCVLGVALAAEIPAVPTTEWDGRIVGGSTAGVNQFPHKASLRSTANAHFCGGSIISNRWVLSAAHCTVGRSAASTIVVVGATSRTAGGIRHNVSRITNHGSYNANTIANDVCVIQTATTIAWASNVGSIPIGTGTVGGGVNGVIAGWGQTAHPGSAAANLMFLNKQTLTNANCQARHTVNNRPLIFASTLCAGGSNNQGICMGDSGGGLIIGGAVHGIASWVIPCGRGFPDSYARVGSFTTWIINNAQ
jgi:secreted trypsin-like serine protease